MIVLQKFELLQSAVSLLYPPGCTICGKSIRAGEYLCDQCETKAVRIVAPFCQKCSEPFEGSLTNTFACANCAHRTIYFDAAVAAYRGRGIVRQIIHEFKYGRQIYLRHLVGRWLNSALDVERVRADFETRERLLRSRGHGSTRINLMAIFKKPAIKAEAGKKREIPRGLFQKCPGCSEVVPEIELSQNQRVCPRCDYHF